MMTTTATQGTGTANASCQLHDVTDVVGYVRSVVTRAAADLDEPNREDLQSQLLLDAVKMSGIRHGHYPVGPQPRGVYSLHSACSFSTWLGWQLPRRIIDWKRRTLGDTRNKTQVTLCSYDQASSQRGIEAHSSEHGDIAPIHHTVREDRLNSTFATDPRLVIDQAFIAIGIRELEQSHA